MDQEPDVIRHNIEETRSALTQKLETLENQVRGTVQNARASVEETMQTVRSTVNHTVESVKETLDLRQHVQRHPWAMVGGSVAAGFLVGSYLESRACQPARHPNGATGDGALKERHDRATAMQASAPVPPGPSRPRPGLFSRFLHEFDDEIEQVKEMAIGASMGLLRDYLKQSLPQFEEQIAQVLNSATQKMGGKPMHASFAQEQPYQAGRRHST